MFCHFSQLDVIAMRVESLLIARTSLSLLFAFSGGVNVCREACVELSFCSSSIVAIHYFESDGRSHILSVNPLIE